MWKAVLTFVLKSSNFVHFVLKVSLISTATCLVFCIVVENEPNLCLYVGLIFALKLPTYLLYMRMNLIFVLKLQNVVLCMKEVVQSLYVYVQSHLIFALELGKLCPFYVVNIFFLGMFEDCLNLSFCMLK